MKASIKFREDEKPLFRAKIPLNILGFPFQSGISAGYSKELCLNLSTFFESGPLLKIVYRPNDSWNPFSLVVKTGIGHFGSPLSAPMTMSAEFNLLGRGNPSFFLQFKPQIGDFSIKKSAESLIALPSQSAVIVPKIISNANDLDSDAEGSVDGGETPIHDSAFRPEEDLFTNKKINKFSLFSGMEVNARTVLPVRNRTVLKFRWGLRFPPELKSGFKENGIRHSMAQILPRKIPFLVMSKITIEDVADDDWKGSTKRDPATPFPGNADLAGAYLEAMQVESGSLRQAVEELRSDIYGGKAATVGGGQDTGKYKESERSGWKSPAVRNGRRSGERKPPEFGGVAGNMTEADVSEQLKTLMGGAS